MTDKRKQRRGGFYWMTDGEKEAPFVSVTNVLKVIDKPALRWWFGKEVYLSMVKDPTLDQRTALAAPYRESSRAKERGSAIHKIIEGYKKGDAGADVPIEFKGYAQAFYKWVDDMQFKILENEKTVYSEVYRYAGTLDMVAEAPGGKIYILDFKTGKDIYMETALQLSAYQEALEQMNYTPATDAIAVVLLQESGNYKFQEMRPVFDVFLHVKALWEWMNKEKLEKLNYKKGGDIHDK